MHTNSTFFPFSPPQRKHLKVKKSDAILDGVSDSDALRKEPPLLQPETDLVD